MLRTVARRTRSRVRRSGTWSGSGVDWRKGRRHGRTTRFMTGTMPLVSLCVVSTGLCTIGFYSRFMCVQIYEEANK